MQPCARQILLTFAHANPQRHGIHHRETEKPYLKQASHFAKRHLASSKN